MLVLAVAGGAWALFGRGTEKNGGTTAIGPVAASTTPTPKVIGPQVPGVTKPTATSLPSVSSRKPVAATAAPVTSQPAPTAAAPTKTAATAAPKATASSAPKPVSPPPAVTPVVTAPQQGGTVAKKAYTFRVARGDTLWSLTKATLARTGRSTSDSNVSAFVTKLYQANATKIGSNPDLIYHGETIVWPAGL